MLQEMHATARQKDMLADARKARLVAQLGTSGDGRPSNRRHSCNVTLAAARALLNGGAVLAWDFSPKGVRFGR